MDSNSLSPLNVPLVEEVDRDVSDMRRRRHTREGDMRNGRSSPMTSLPHKILLSEIKTYSGTSNVRVIIIHCSQKYLTLTCHFDLSIGCQDGGIIKERFPRNGA